MVNAQLERMWKETVVACEKFCHGIRFRRLKKTERKRVIGVAVVVQTMRKRYHTSQVA